ncbi:AAA family ATPase (plasmid) [Clostridium perfringens]|nr:hypothetical protein [Clostridium perfringens]
MARRKFKRNQVKASILGYYYYIRGVEKAGKTTLFYDINEKLYGNQDHGLLISMGKEDGYKALPDIQVEVIDDITKIDEKGKTKIVKNAWKQFVELVDDLVLDKMENDTDIELIGIDTYDELCRLTSAEVVRQSNKKNPTKQCESINGAFGGFNGGFEKFEELVEEQLHRLRQVGYTLFVISHTKVRTIKEKGMTEDDAYQMLTTNLDSRFDKVVAHKADVIATIQIDKEIQDGKLLGTKRYIYFREDGFVKAGSRFKDIVDRVELSADNFIKAIEDGIRASLRKPISDEEFKEKKKEDEQERQDKIEHNQEINEAIKTEIDVERNRVIGGLIPDKFKVATPEQKAKVKDLMAQYGIAKLLNAEENKTEGMEQILKVLS